MDSAVEATRISAGAETVTKRVLDFLDVHSREGSKIVGIEGFHAREQLGDSPVPVDIRGFQHNCTVVKQGMLKGYRAAISDMRCQERYDQKLTLIGGEDPYELPQSAWIDDVDAWPAITYIHIKMYLVYSSSPYTSEALMNYKSLDCYQRFVAGWVNGVYVRVGV